MFVWFSRYVNGRFRDERQCTIGTDFLTKKVDCEGREVVVQLWDTAGLERFHLSALGASFYRGADGCVLVYDAKNRNSFDSLIHWRDEVLRLELIVTSAQFDNSTFIPFLIISSAKYQPIIPCRLLS